MIMTDNEIIKALECCTDPNEPCPNCPYEGETTSEMYCDEKLMVDALNFINRQKEEIERFGFEHRAMAKAINCYIKEVEELVHEKDNLIKTYKEYRADAIKGFAKLVYKTLTTEQNWRDLKQAWLYNGECEWLENILNNLVKEKIGDDNDK